jgi:glycosyltransferase involved in cell wall biosynthesis
VSGGDDTVHVVLPGGVDDPARPSGGNRYGRRVCTGLAHIGWAVCEHVAPGTWPRPGPADLAGLAAALAAIPDGALLLVDGLIAAAAPAVLVPEGDRLRLVVLAHMPLGDVEVPAAAEETVLTHARGVVTVSAWTRDRLLGRYALDPARVTVAHPGVDPGPDRLPPAPGARGGGRLLCVGVLAPHKGQDVLVAALAGLPQPGWRCTVVGSPDREPGFAARLRRQATTAGLGDRIAFRGPCRHEDLAAVYAAADLLVAPSRVESYGMVVTEALAAGLPAVATAVGGLPEALGTTPGGLPGLLVPPDDPAALRAALAAWLRDAGLRERLRRAARHRRAELPGWETTARRLAAALTAARAEPALSRPRAWWS